MKDFYRLSVSDSVVLRTAEPLALDEFILMVSVFIAKAKMSKQVMAQFVEAAVQSGRFVQEFQLTRTVNTPIVVPTKIHSVFCRLMYKSLALMVQDKYHSLYADYNTKVISLVRFDGEASTFVWNTFEDLEGIVKFVRAHMHTRVSEPIVRTEKDNKESIVNIIAGSQEGEKKESAPAVVFPQVEQSEPKAQVATDTTTLELKPIPPKKGAKLNISNPFNSSIAEDIMQGTLAPSP